MKAALRLIFLVSVGAIVASDLPRNSAVLLATGGCVCSGSADAYQYAGPLYKGTYSDTGIAGTAGSQYQCADMCQIWINSNVGHVACSNFGLGAGTGYVIENWLWEYHGEDPPPSGHIYNEQYDCGDI
jgi:hypothetical protein